MIAALSDLADVVSTPRMFVVVASAVGGSRRFATTT